AYVRADAAVASAGVVRWEEANRRVHGRPTGERLGRPEAPFFRVRGRSGELFVAAPPGTGRLIPLQLEDDVLYVREDAVLAFEGTVSWEYGHIPRATVGMLQFRGRGLVAVCVRGEPGSVKVSPERPVQAAARNLLGWVGQVVAHGGLHDVGISSSQARLSSPGPLPITCEGEGVVLLDVEDRGGPDRLAPATFTRGGFEGPFPGPVFRG
ncbi:MAG TPA: AIM24 family protein, partial [Polyangia bacterium]